MSLNMGKPKGARLFAIVLACIITGQAVAVSSEQTGRGTITAKVVDSNGKPIFEAIVQMLPTDRRGPQRAAIRECLTNKNGTCELDLNFNSYHVTAMKKSDGYPDLSFNFYGHGKWLSTVALTPERPSITITLKLGPKAASLVLHVVDSLTGVAVKNTTVTLRPSDNPHDFLSTSLDPDCKVLIPPGEDVTVEVSADGYKATKVRFTSTGESIRLRSGESKEIKIPLEALPKAR